MFRCAFTKASYDDRSADWRRIDYDWLSGADDLALQLDNATNNTSLVLAIELIDDGRVLLMPADAQLGNCLSWEEVPLEITESAKVDGALPIRTHLSIIIPYLKAPLAILLTLRIGALFRSFDITWLLTKGGPGYATTTLPIQYYKTAFEAMDVGKGSAVAVHILLFVFLVYFIIYKMFGKDAFS
jgi:hypothetical protein